MAVSSMTGYGTAERAWTPTLDGADTSPSGPHRRLLVEVRSVNARFLELKVRQPFGATVESQRLVMVK